jgi:hypothetical protein
LLYLATLLKVLGQAPQAHLQSDLLLLLQEANREDSAPVIWVSIHIPATPLEF